MKYKWVCGISFWVKASPKKKSITVYMTDPELYPSAEKYMVMRAFDVIRLANGFFDEWHTPPLPCITFYTSHGEYLFSFLDWAEARRVQKTAMKVLKDLKIKYRKVRIKNGK